MRQLLGDCLCRPICFFDLPIVFRSFETPVMQIHATLQSVIGAFYRQTHLTTFGETMVLSFRGQQVAATTSRGTSQLANPSKPKQIKQTWSKRPDMLTGLWGMSWHVYATRLQDIWNWKLHWSCAHSLHVTREPSKEPSKEPCLPEETLMKEKLFRRWNVLSFSAVNATWTQKKRVKRGKYIWKIAFASLV